MSKTGADSKASRKARGLSEEDRALWEQVAKSAKPLRKRNPATHAGEAAKRSSDHKAPPPVVRKDKPQKVATAAPAPPAPKKPPAFAPMDRRTKARVARGDMDIAARIDLHGMTQEQAHIVLQRFIHRAHDENLGLVLVITGKGRMADEHRERGVLRRQVPLWLAMADLRALVIGFEEAHVAHGGAGALYVRVRKRRR